jgi:ribitol-5-phosphate 2-dehydrogenase (NADP+) / D-ribitol-5-phosphate cytidylyltransferase
MEIKNSFCKTTALILAGGVGERFGSEIPKQFVNLNGKPVIQHSIETLKKSGLIDSIIIVCLESWVDFCQQFGADKVVIGGKTRNESTFNGLLACPLNTKFVLIHDAVRPFLDINIIKRCLDAIKTHKAVDTSINITDTIIEIDNSNQILSIPDRRKLKRGQTPQVFEFETILKAYQTTSWDKMILSDDIGLLQKQGIPCITVEGSEWNMKITTAPDLFIAERIMQFRDAIIRKPEVRGKTILVFGGSGGIGSEVVKQLKELGATVIAPKHTEVDLSSDSIPSFLLKLKPDSIINCAGSLQKGLDCFSEVMNINFRSAIVIVQYAKKVMSNGGNIVFVGSSSAMKGRKDFPIYSASKAALNNFTEGIAEELKEYNIRVNCVNPARTDTSMLASLNVTGGGLAPSTVAEAIISYCDTDLTGQIVNIRKTS